MSRLRWPTSCALLDTVLGPDSETQTAPCAGVPTESEGPKPVAEKVVEPPKPEKINPPVQFEEGRKPGESVEEREGQNTLDPHGPQESAGVIEKEARTLIAKPRVSVTKRR